MVGCLNMDDDGGGSDKEDLNGNSGVGGKRVVNKANMDYGNGGRRGADIGCGAEGRGADVGSGC